MGAHRGSSEGLGSSVAHIDVGNQGFLDPFDKERSQALQSAWGVFSHTATGHRSPSQPVGWGRAKKKAS